MRAQFLIAPTGLDLEPSASILLPKAAGEVGARFGGKQVVLNLS